MSLYTRQKGSFLALREIADAITSTSISVANTSTAVLSANPERIEAVLINDSNETIYLGIGTAAVINKGIRLNANGGSYVERNSMAAINAISTNGSKNLCVVEKYHA